MKVTDRKKLERLYKCLNIPKFASGLKSMTVTGVSSYASDCAFAIPQTQLILYSIGAHEEWPGQTEKLLTEFEEWHRQRTIDDWSND